MKLGIICESSANAYYRAVFPLGALERRGHEVVWPGVHRVDVPLRELVGCDLVHCYRRMDRLADLRELSRYGVAISFDNDDDYSSMEITRHRSALAGRKSSNRIARMSYESAKIADLVTTTSRCLVDQYRAVGASNVVAIENRLKLTMDGFGERTEHHDIVIGWVAQLEHKTDLESVPIASALRDVLGSYSEVRVQSIGLRLPLQSERYEHLGPVDFPDLLKTMHLLDIGIAPLADTPFNRARSNVKLKEYASVGAVWLASPIEPYCGLSEAQGGRLVADDQWAAKIGELVEKKRKRRLLARRALKWAREQTVDRHAAQWENVFLEAIE